MMGRALIATKHCRGVIALALLLQVAASPAAFAQVPPHVAGTICFTPEFWCWASPAGLVGERCTCPTPAGNVEGTLG